MWSRRFSPNNLSFFPSKKLNWTFYLTYDHDSQTDVLNDNNNKNNNNKIF